MEFLSKDITFYIGLRLDMKDLSSLSRVCRRMNGLLCGSVEFWRVKYCKEFGLEGIDEVVMKQKRGRRNGSSGINYKELYRETLKNVRFLKTVYNEFMNSYVDSKLVMNLYNKVFKYFSLGKGFLHHAALILSLIHI